MEPARGAPLGPNSLSWQFFADRRMALLGPRAAVLQNMLPALGQGVDDHSVWFAETLGRLQRSIPPIFETLYGVDADASGHEVRDFHRTIKGRLPEQLGGGHYSALNPDTYYWAHATFVEHLATAADTFIRPLTDADRDQIVAESLTWYARYGVSVPRNAPTTWAELDTYFDDAYRNRLVRHRTAAYGVGFAIKGWPRPAKIPAPLWAVLSRPLNTVSAFVTIGGMPEPGRRILGLPWTERQERRYRRFAGAVRSLDPVFRRLPRTVTMHPIAVRAFAREAGATTNTPTTVQIIPTQAGSTGRTKGATT